MDERQDAGRRAGPSRRHRIAVLDDHILVLEGLAKWIQVNAPDFDVVSAAGSWPELLRDLALAPDVVIMAQKMDDTIPVAERIRACIESGTKVVIMSSTDTAELRTESLDAGAAAFVPKSRPAAEVVHAARLAALGELGDCTSWLAAEQEWAIADSDLAILRLYARGHSTVDISLVLGVKFEAVRRALKRIRELYSAQGRKADTRDGLIRRAAEDGYLGADQ